MKKGYTDITFVIDRSGSMQGLVTDVIGGFNSFIEEQKKVEGEATVTLVQFDNYYEECYVAKPIDEVESLDFSPRGTTALLDAMGRAMNSTGHENASREFDIDTIKSMVQTQQDTYSWEVVFMGANIDAVGTANMFGIKSGNAIKFGANSDGVHNAYASFSKNMTMFRSGSKLDMSYDSDDIQAQTDAGVTQS
jgi:hypothetical protein